MRNHNSHTNRLNRFSSTSARFASFYGSVSESATDVGQPVSGNPIPDTAQVGPRFLSVESVARIFDVSRVTVYREIRCGRFPAVRLRGRYVVPAKVVAAMEDAAMELCALVDPADWVQGEALVDEIGRPRPGGNQTGAGSPVTQQEVRGALSSMPDTDSLGTRGRAAGGAR